MIQKLKRKFILVNMALVFAVLMIVFTALCFSTYRQQTTEQNRSLDQLLARRDNPDSKIEIGKPSGPDSSMPQKSGTLVAGFVVTVDETGAITVTAGNSVSVSDEIAQSVSQTALLAGSDGGLIRTYSLKFLRETDGGETRIAFLDVSDDLTAMTELIVTSLLVGGVGLAAFFFISLFLANWALKPVAKAWSQQKQFVADASHELKTPLTVILANQKILLAHPERTVGEEAQWIENTQSEGNRMKSLIQDLLFLAKTDSDRVEEPASDVCFSDVAQGALLSFASVAFEAGVQLEDEIAPGVTLCGSEPQLRRLCGILIDNAVKYADRGGNVLVTLASDGAACRLSVHNTGAPIPKAELPRLFERFYRVNRARSAGGFGLGLSIAESIARSHGGRIGVVSAEGSGTTFTVTLPLAPAGKRKNRRRLV